MTEGIPSQRQLPSAAVVEVAAPAPEAQQLMVPRSGGPGLRAPSALMLPPHFPSFLSFLLLGHPRLGSPLQGAAGMPELAGALCFAAWLR